MQYMIKVELVQSIFFLVNSVTKLHDIFYKTLLAYLLYNVFVYLLCDFVITLEVTLYYRHYSSIVFMIHVLKFFNHT